MLSSGGKKDISPKDSERDLGVLKALFDQDPTAAVKVAESSKGFARVNMALPMVAKRRMGEDTFTYVSTQFGSVVQDTKRDPLLTRQSLLEMRQKGELPEGVECMIKEGIGDFPEAVTRKRKQIVDAVEGGDRGGEVVRTGRVRAGEVVRTGRGGSQMRGGAQRDGKRVDKGGGNDKGDEWKW